MLEVIDLSKTYNINADIIKGADKINFNVTDGQFISIIGKSGSGKSTLLSLLGALDKPTKGHIIVDGEDITRMSDNQLIKYRGRSIGFVFQNYNLIPNLTALENVMLPMEFAGLAKTARISRAEKLLDQVGLKAEMHRKPGKLSGGQQQRVAIARALANKPKIILADEPTGNLDSDTGKKIFQLLHDLSRTQNTTIIVVTHDLTITSKTDKTYILKDGSLRVQRP